MENSYQKFAKDVLIIGIANALAALSGIIFMPLITKTLGAYNYGIWAQVQVTISLVLVFVGLGLPGAVVRFLPAKTDIREIQEGFYSIFCVVSLSAVIVSIALIAAADFIAGAFFDGATLIVRITGLIILVQSLDQVFLTLFRAFRQMKQYAIITIANTYVQVGLMAYLVLNGHGILSIVLVVLAIKAVMLIVLFCLVKSQIGVRRPRFSWIKEYLAYGLPLVPVTMASWVINSSDRYVVGYFLGIASVGVYSAAYTLGRLPFMLAEVLGFVLPPALSRLYDEGRMEEVKTHLRYSLKYLLAASIPFVCGAFVLAGPVLRVFSTAEIAAAGALVVPLVALGILFACANSVIYLILVLAKKTKVLGAVFIVAALANLGLNILAVPRWGILGAAVTTLIAYGTALGLTTYYSFKKFKFPIDWRFVAKSLIASAAMSAAVWAIAPQGTLATILAVLTGIGIYGVVLFLLKGFTNEEFKFFRGLFQRG